MGKGMIEIEFDFSEFAAKDAEFTIYDVVGFGEDGLETIAAESGEEFIARGKGEESVQFSVVSIQFLGCRPTIVACF
jgi:hypothetical protein